MKHNKFINKLLDLQEKTYAYKDSNDNEYSCNFEYLPRFSFVKIGKLYEIVFYGMDMMMIQQ